MQKCEEEEEEEREGKMGGEICQNAQQLEKQWDGGYGKRKCLD